jgi:hypothetical protein
MWKPSFGISPIPNRYTFDTVRPATALLVLLAYAIRVGLGDYSGAYGFIFFINPIVASALLFDRWTGFWLSL